MQVRRASFTNYRVRVAHGAGQLMHIQCSWRFGHCFSLRGAYGRVAYCSNYCAEKAKAFPHEVKALSKA